MAETSTRSQAVAAATEQLLAALSEGRSEALTAYLSAMGRFYKYSFSNTMLIACQRPDATRVAGFNTWKSLGRHVRKGEKGIRIFAPMHGRRRTASGAKGEETEGSETGPTLFGFRPGTVFDVAQTEGDDLPSYQTPEMEGDAREHYPRMVEFVRGEGIVLEYQPGLDADGYSCGGRIVLREGMPEVESFSVLVHEYAHEVLHHGNRRKETTRTVRETEAEAVAFVVCSTLGLSTRAAAADYIALYNGAAELLMQSLAHVQQTATAILKELSADTTHEAVALPRAA